MMDIFVRILNPVLMILLGLAAGIIVSRQRFVEWKLYGIGALTFIGSQILHIPFNVWILNPILENLDMLTEGAYLVILAITLGLSAGVFEETFRYFVYRFWIKDARRWKDGLMFGAGHGGIEAILLGILSLLTVFQIVTLSEQDLSRLIPEEQLPLAEAQIAAFWAVPWYGVFLGAIERVFALCFHIAASVLVLQVFQRRNILWLFGAIGLHAGLDALAVYGARAWGPYITEGALALFTVFSLAIIFVLRTEEQQEETPFPPPPLPEIRRMDITQDQIEDSKYG